MSSSTEKTIRYVLRIEAFKMSICCCFRDRREEDRFKLYSAITINDPNYMVEIDFNSGVDILLEDIIHEMTHAIRASLVNRKGFQGLEDWGDEVLPYCLAYGVRKVLEFCCRKGIKVKYI